MRRGILWVGVTVGAVLIAAAITAPGPWVGLPVGVVAMGACGTLLADG